jgi:hypothetical protein
MQDVLVIPEEAKNAARVGWYSLVAGVAGSERGEKELCELRAGLSRNWCKVVTSLVFWFGGKFEAHCSFLFLCSIRPSRTCKRALSG